MIEKGDPRWILPELAYRNLGHLMVVEALLGQIGPEMHAISVDFDGGDELRLHIALTCDYPEFDQDVANILDEVEYKFATIAYDLAMTIRTEVVKYVGVPGPDWPGHGFSMVYRAKEYDDSP